MSHRELIALGTASQVPTKHRNHNGYLLRWDGHGLLFDPGEGTQRQMTRFGVATGAITRILVTHFHGDHCLGLPGMLQRISLDGVGHPVTVHYPSSGQRYFERLRHASIYDDRADIKAAPIKGNGQIADMPELTIEARLLDHRVDAYGFRICERDGVRFLPEALAEAGVSGRAVGELARNGTVVIGDRVVRVEDVSVPRLGQKMAFIMDTRICDAARELAMGVDLLVCESTYLDEDAELAHKYGHMTAGEAGMLARDAGARSLVLTHFSRRYPSTEGFLAQARAHVADVHAAFDGFRMTMPGRGDSAQGAKTGGEGPSMV